MAGEARGGPGSQARTRSRRAVCARNPAHSEGDDGEGGRCTLESRWVTAWTVPSGEGQDVGGKTVPRLRR